MAAKFAWEPWNLRWIVAIKARESVEQMEPVEQFPSSDSGASLDDILGAALQDGDGRETCRRTTLPWGFSLPGLQPQRGPTGE